MTNMQSQFLLTKQHTAVLKGLAIIMMIFHHVNIHMVTLSYPLEYPPVYECLGRDAKACIALFAFVTGYGYFFIDQKATSRMDAWRHCICKFYPRFLCVYVLMVLLSLLFPVGSLQPLNAGQYILGALGLCDTFYDYWYIAFYLLATCLILPLMIPKSKEHLSLKKMIIAVLIMATGYPSGGEIGAVFWHLGMPPEMINSIVSFWSGSPFQTSFVWFPFLFIGWFAAALFVQERIRNSLMLLVSLGFALSFDARYTGILVASILLAFIFCRFTNRVSACLSALGASSAYMWLNHRLIFGYWFADICYSYPPPINFLIVVPLSYLLALAMQVSIEWIFRRGRLWFAFLKNRLGSTN